MLKFLFHPPRRSWRQWWRRAWPRLWRQMPSDLEVFRAWAAPRGFELRVVRGEHAGCVLEGALAGRACRLEWGPPQRSYIGGAELRLMADLDLPRDLVLLLLNRGLQEWMEETVYAQYVHDVQTRADTDTPIEMRWLVMYSRAGAAELGRLRERYGVVSNLLPWAGQWLGTPVNDALAAAAEAFEPGHPVVISIKSGRLQLRTRMSPPNAAALVQWTSVFEHAVREAHRMGAAWRDQQSAGPQTQPHAWPLGMGPATRTARTVEVDIGIPIDQT